jgi:hypothetical protein
MPALGPVAGLPIASLWGAASAPVIPSVGPESYEPASPVPRGYPHVSVWSDLACRDGVPIRRLPALLDWSERHRLEGFLVTHQWNGTIPTQWEGTTELLEGRVLRVVRRPGDIREYILTTLDDGINTGGITTLMAEGVESLLATMGRVAESLSGSAPSDVFTRILDAAESWLQLGVIQPTDPLDVADAPAGGQSVGAAIRHTCAAIQQRTSTTYEVALVRGSETTYFLQVAIYREFAPVVDLPTGVATLSLTRRRTLTTRMTRAFDPSAGMANSFWTVLDVDGSVVDLGGLDGGIGLAIEGGQWVGAFIQDTDGDAHEILDVEVLTPQVTRLTLDGVGSLAEGDLVRLVADADGGAITEALLPSAEAALPRPILRPVSSGASPVTNFVTNPAFRDWVGNVPTGWTVVAGGMVRSTTPGTFLTGGGSVLMTEDVTSTLRWEGSAYFPEGGPAVKVQYWARVRVDRWVSALVGDDAWEDVRLNMGVIVIFTPPGTYQVVQGPENQPFGEWFELRHEQILPAPGPGQSGIRRFGINFTNYAETVQPEPFSPLPWRARLFVDAAMVTVSPTLPGFFIGSGPARAIQQANLDFLAFGGPQQSLTVDPIDLARLDPEGAGYYRTLRLGARTRILGRGLGVDQELRVLEHLEPGRGARAQLTLDTRPALLSRTLAARL